MRILLYADPIVPVPPPLYGGAERSIAALAAALVSLGHEVRLLAGPGSTEGLGRLFVHHAPSESRWASRALRKVAFQPLSLRAARGVDVVHAWGRIDYLWAMLRTSRPLVVTFQAPLDRPSIESLVRARRQHLVLASASDFHRRDCSDLGRWLTVYNGIDLAPYPRPGELRERAARRQARLLGFVGRINPEKAPHLAAEVARRTGHRLLIAGPIPGREPAARSYFERAVRPFLLEGTASWIGEIDETAKIDMLSQCRGFLFPIQWDEPMGMAPIEANACGVPVIAARRAATPEIVRHGVTGYLCDDLDAMTSAVERLDEIDPVACRHWVDATFSPERMAEGYIRAYREAMSA